jgi:hypothetical protein
MHGELTNLPFLTLLMVCTSLRYSSAIISLCNAAENISQMNGLFAFNFKTQRLSCARTTCALLESFASRWSEKYMPITFVRYADLALSALLADLDNVESSNMFAANFMIFHTLVARVPIAAQMLQRVQERATKAHIALPQATIYPDQRSN